MSLDISFSKTRCCPNCGTALDQSEIHSQNITHNLNRMADAAGIYKCLWRPDENGFDTAGQLIEPLAFAIEQMKCYPERFDAYNASNGWGTREQFIPWLEELYSFCLSNPDTTISVSR